MTDLLIILCTVISATSIWKLRQQSEFAKEIITRHCQQLDLQLLSVARSSFYLKPGARFLEASFLFEFSSDNDNNYQGKVYLLKGRKPCFELPPYRCFD
jgi:hypothetical protein